MEYEVGNFDHILGTKGFSDDLLKNHLELYKAYVKNINKFKEAIGKLSYDDPAFGELNRRLGWEWNGMRLHEYYFENITNEPETFDITSEIYEKIIKDFGSYENWEKDFKAKGMIRGNGWVILYFDALYDKLDNLWIDEHHKGHPADGLPLLVMDVFEHAYMLDYGINRKDYIDSFMKHIDWEVISSRF